MNYDRSDIHGDKIPQKFLKHREGFKKVGKNLFKVTPRPISVDEFNKLVTSKVKVKTLMKTAKVSSMFTPVLVGKFFKAQKYDRVLDPVVINSYEKGEEILKDEIFRWVDQRLSRDINYAEQKINNLEVRLSAEKKRLSKLKQKLKTIHDEPEPKVKAPTPSSVGTWSSKRVV